jgi:hypothetical protein
MSADQFAKASQLTKVIAVKNAVGLSKVDGLAGERHCAIR